MAFTEFYSQAGGDNRNAGSTNNNTAAYTSTNGNWVSATTFTPTDGSIPANFVNVGDFGSVMLDAGTITVFVARITAVAAGVNGAISFSTTVKSGAAPSTLTTGRTLRVGGAFGLSPVLVVVGTTWGLLQNIAGNPLRINLKNDATYAISAFFTCGSPAAPVIIQGYTTNPGDLGKALFQASSAAVMSCPTSSITWTDIIFTTTFASGSIDMIVTSVGSNQFNRCIFHGARGNGISAAGNLSLIECEFYDNNKGNAAGASSLEFNGTGLTILRSIFHDNTGGANGAGILIDAANAGMIQNCIFDSNSGAGITTSGAAGGSGFCTIENCDFYNNTLEGIALLSVGGSAQYRIENCNFIKNGGAGIKNLGVTPQNICGEIHNNGFGSGSMANGAANTLGPIVDDGTSVIYPSGLTPWVDPANGNFRINLPQANFAGRGAFQQTAPSYAGTAGFPDIGAAQSKTGIGGTFSKEVSGASAQ